MRRGLGTQRVCLKIGLFDLPTPMIDQPYNLRQDKAMVRGRIFFEIPTRHAHELMRGPQTWARGGPFGVFVHGQVHKSTGQLNKGLVKVRIISAARLQPQILQHIVRLVKLPGIKALKIAEVTRIMRPVR